MAAPKNIKEQLMRKFLAITRAKFSQADLKSYLQVNPDLLPGMAIEDLASLENEHVERLISVDSYMASTAPF